MPTAPGKAGSPVLKHNTLLSPLVLEPARGSEGSQRERFVMRLVPAVCYQGHMGINQQVFHLGLLTVWEFHRNMTLGSCPQNHVTVLLQWIWFKSFKS